MKRIIILLSVFALSLGAFAQGDLNNATYLTFNWFKPTGFGLPFAYDAHSKDIKDARQLGLDRVLHFGGSIAVGGHYYINKINFLDGLRFGINTDYFELSANYLNLADDIGVSTNDVSVRLSPKVGIVTSYAPLDFMKLDLFFRWAPMIGGWYNEGYDDGGMQYSVKRVSLGFAYRITKAYIGVEYIWATTNLYDSGFYHITDIEDNVFKLSLGLNFDD